MARDVTSLASLFEQAFRRFHDKRIEEQLLPVLVTSEPAVKASLSPSLIPFEKRGITLLVFQRVRDFCLSKKAASGYWSIGRVGAEIVGNHEILTTAKKDADETEAIAQGKPSDSIYRWGKNVDPSSTLTFAGRCSLVDMIRQGLFGPNSPLGCLRYDDVVGQKANIFISFAYSSDFVELVDALECFFDRNPCHSKESTYLWFDLFVNDQWTALDKPFEWWETTFKEAVEEIGHTVVVMLPWEAPIPLTRVWCLFEIACSKKLSVALSNKQVGAFQEQLRRDFSAIQTSLCKIDVEQATSFLPEDKEKIFAAIRSKKGGFQRLNVYVSSKIREWIQECSRAFAQEMAHAEDQMEALEASNSLGIMYFEQHKYLEAEQVWMRVLEGFEAHLGPDHPKALGVIFNLGMVFKNQGKLDKSERFLTRALRGTESHFGFEHSKTLSTLTTLAALYYEQGRTELAVETWERGLKGQEKVCGPESRDTLTTKNNLATVYLFKGKLVEAEEMLTGALNVLDRTLGPDHPLTLTTRSNLGELYLRRCKMNEAIENFTIALKGFEKVYDRHHPQVQNIAKQLTVLQLIAQSGVNVVHDVNDDSLSRDDIVRKAFARYGIARHGRAKHRDGTSRSEHNSSTRDSNSSSSSGGGGSGGGGKSGSVGSGGGGGSSSGGGGSGEAMHTAAALGEESKSGLAFFKQGKLEEARDAYTRASRGFEKLYGPRHPSTKMAKENLSIIQQRLNAIEARGGGEGEGGEDLDNRTAFGEKRDLFAEEGKEVEKEGKEKKEGKDAEAPAAYKAVLVEELAKLDPLRLLEAESKEDDTVQQEKLKSCRKWSRSGHDLYMQDRLEEAADFYAKAIFCYEGIYSPFADEVPEFLIALASYADVKIAQKKDAEAEEMYVRAIAGLEEVKGEHHIQTLAAICNLAHFYKDTKKFAEAEQFLLRSLCGFERKFGLEHQETMATVVNLGDLYHRIGNLSAAEAMYTRASQGQEKLVGSPRDIATTVLCPGAIHEEQGKLQEAEAMPVRAKVGFENKVFDIEHHKTSFHATLCKLEGFASLLSQQGAGAGEKPTVVDTLVCPPSSDSRMRTSPSDVQRDVLQGLQQEEKK